MHLRLFSVERLLAKSNAPISGAVELKVRSDRDIPEKRGPSIVLLCRARCQLPDQPSQDPSAKFRIRFCAAGIA